MAPHSLEGKVVLITGASSGIGEALAKVFYLAGSKVILAARREAELLRVKNELLTLAPQGGRKQPTLYEPQILQLDLGDFSSIPDKCAQALAPHGGRVDILINNGGISNRGTVAETGLDVFQRVMDVNYIGSVAMTKALLPKMMEGGSGGVVVFISSVGGKISIPHRSAYTASKHALQAFADSLRAEVSSRGVRVTVISPGPVHTNISRNALLTGAEGAVHGKMDEETAAGYSAEYVAARTLKAIVNGEKDVLVAPFVTGRLALWIHYWFPGLFSNIMVRRAQREEGKKEE